MSVYPQKHQLHEYFIETSVRFFPDSTSFPIYDIIDLD